MSAAALTKARDRRIDAILKRLHTAKSHANENLMAVGECLIELRDEYDDADEFLEKAIAETGFGRTTIYSYMTIYRDWKGKPDLLDRFDFKALEVLAKDSTPDEAIKRITKVAKDGNFVSAKLAREIVAECSKPDNSESVNHAEKETSAIRPSGRKTPKSARTTATGHSAGVPFDADEHGYPGAGNMAGEDEPIDDGGPDAFAKTAADLTSLTELPDRTAIVHEAYLLDIRRHWLMEPPWSEMSQERMLACIDQLRDRVLKKPRDA
jgi:DNA-binding NarL/FixJ family response regulator